MSQRRLRYLLMVIMLLLPSLSHGNPAPKGKKFAIGASLLGGVVAGAVMTKALSAPTEQHVYHHNAESTAISSQQAHTNGPTIQNSQILANGCIVQILHEPSLQNAGQFTETRQMVCPASVPGVAAAPQQVMPQMPFLAVLPHNVPVMPQTYPPHNPPIPQYNPQSNAQHNPPLAPVSVPQQNPPIPNQAYPQQNPPLAPAAASQPQPNPQKEFQAAPQLYPVLPQIVPQQIPQLEPIPQTAQQNPPVTPQAVSQQNSPAAPQAIPQQNPPQVAPPHNPPQTIPLPANLPAPSQVLPQPSAPSVVPQQPSSQVYVISKKTGYYPNNTKSNAIGSQSVNIFLLLISITFLFLAKTM